MSKVNIIHLCGTQRGGQHYIMNNIIESYDHDIYFKNNGVPIYYPEESRLHEHWRLSHVRSGELSNKNNILIGSENVCLIESEYKNPFIESLRQEGTWFPPDDVFWSLDDIKESLKKHVENFDIKYIQVIRNPLNVLASCLERSKRESYFADEEYLSQIMFVLLGMIDLEISNPNLLYLSYDKFILSDDYKNNLYSFLGNSKKLSNHIQGSSFINNETTGFLDRHKEYEDDKFYQKIVDQYNLLEYTEKYKERFSLNDVYTTNSK